jgi:hypothetical protein
MQPAATSGPTKLKRTTSLMIVAGKSFRETPVFMETCPWQRSADGRWVATRTPLSAVRPGATTNRPARFCRVRLVP